MTRSLKSGKGKRGISYPRRRMEEMIDRGLTTREMAEILGTDSLQSVRHAVEQIKRERNELIELEKQHDEMEARRKSITHVGIFPYSISDHNLKAMEYILPRSQIGIKIISTPQGKAILSDPDFQSTVEKLYGFGFYGRLCSSQDLDSNIAVLYANKKRDEKLQLEKLFTTIVRIEYTQSDKDKVQALLFPYMEKGSIYFQDVENIYFTKTANTEDLLRSMQHEFNKSQLHIHLEYNPMMVAESGYILSITDNIMEIISESTWRDLENIILKEILDQKKQISIKTTMYRTYDFSRNSARSHAIMDQLGNMSMRITEKIPVFPTEEQRKRIEVEAMKNTASLMDRIDQAFRHIDDLMKGSL